MALSAKERYQAAMRRGAEAKRRNSNTPAERVMQAGNVINRGAKLSQRPSGRALTGREKDRIRRMGGDPRNPSTMDLRRAKITDLSPAQVFGSNVSIGPKAFFPQGGTPGPSISSARIDPGPVRASGAGSYGGTTAQGAAQSAKDVAKGVGSKVSNFFAGHSGGSAAFAFSRALPVAGALWTGGNMLKNVGSQIGTHGQGGAQGGRPINIHHPANKVDFDRIPDKKIFWYQGGRAIKDKGLIVGIGSNSGPTGHNRSAFGLETWDGTYEGGEPPPPVEPVHAPAPSISPRRKSEKRPDDKIKQEDIDDISKPGSGLEDTLKQPAPGKEPTDYKDENKRPSLLKARRYFKKKKEEEDDEES